MPLSRLPWGVNYVARRAAGISILLAEQISVAAFPSAPQRREVWDAAYAAGLLDTLAHAEPQAAPSS